MSVTPQCRIDFCRGEAMPLVWVDYEVRVFCDAHNSDYVRSPECKRHGVGTARLPIIVSSLSDFRTRIELEARNGQ